MRNFLQCCLTDLAWSFNHTENSKDIDQTAKAHLGIYVFLEFYSQTCGFA